MDKVHAEAMVALHSADPAAREAAARTLGRLGDASALPALLDALIDADRWVWQAAAWAIRQLPESAVTAAQAAQ